MKNHKRAILAFAFLSASLALSSPINAHELPVGDGKVSTGPKVGYVFACNQNFRGGGARHTGEWFHGDTWDPSAKPHVKGKVMWPDATFSMSPSGPNMAVQGNSLPVGQATGNFPIDESDPAYQYDTNPNSIKPTILSFSIPAQPVKSSSVGCLSMGMIGFTITGVPFYNALDAAGRDAAAHEVQDLCDGHPQGKGQYHYHSSSPCLPGAKSNEVVGWALDGYPILGMNDGSGKRITNADLDSCHGRQETINIDGRNYDYGYRLTEEYPYTLGCFSGQVLDKTKQSTSANMGPSGQKGEKRKGAGNSQSAGLGSGPGSPPQEALDACATLNQGDTCSFVGRGGNQRSGTCGTPPKMKNSGLLCMPKRG